MPVLDQAFVTLATNDTYALGALVVGHSLRNVQTSRRTVVMVTAGVTPETRLQLTSVFDIVQEVDVMDSNDAINLGLLARPDLGITFTKLHCWRLTQFNKCVFLDADTLVLQNVDELFEREELSAAPDAGWPDCFNTGVFVYCPSLDTYNALLAFALTHGSFDGGDQGLLNSFFSDWATKDIARHLPFVYNVVSQAFYSYLPAFKQYGKGTKIVHFIGAQKPWSHTYNTSTKEVDIPGADPLHSKEFTKLWWSLFMEKVHPGLTPGLVEITSSVAHLGVSARKQLDERERQFAWERGNVDYKGEDSFENIMKKLDETMTSPAQPSTSIFGAVEPSAGLGPAGEPKAHHK